MKMRILLSLCAISALASTVTVTSATAYAISPSQGQAAAAPTVSEAETQALKAMDALPDTAAKLAAVAEFFKKYPKSSARPQIAERMAQEISKTKDPAQAITLAEKAQTIFTSEPELGMMKVITLDAYAASHRVDDVFRLANEMLAKNPEDVHPLVEATFAGTESVKQKNPKYAQQSLQYGSKAIELIEANKKPAQMTEAQWTAHKEVLPELYQQTAILHMVTGNAAEAKARLIKATALGPKDPSSFALLGLLINDEYVQQATAYKSMPEGKQKEETLKKLQDMLDNIIDVYAHAAALAVGRPEYQALLQQVTTDLTSYYKFRHNQSTEGLQQLIDKYKPQPQP